MSQLLQALDGLKPFIVTMLLPPVPLLVLLLMGAGLLRQHRRIGRLLLALGAAGLWLSCTEVGSDRMQRWLLPVPQVLSPQQVDALRGQPDTAVVVLGAGAYRQLPEYAGPALKPLSLERLRYGVWLSRHTGQPLAFSGGGLPNSFTEAQLAQQVVSEEYRYQLRWAEDRSHDTRDNAVMTMALLKQSGIKHVLLVTHTQHIPRALRAFRQAAGGDVDILAAPVGQRGDMPFEFIDWLPSNNGFNEMRYVLYEWLGLLAGH